MRLLLAAEVLTMQQAVSEVTASLKDQWTGFLGHLPMFIGAAVVLIVTAIVAKIVDVGTARALRNRKIARSLQSLVRQLAYAGVWAAGLVVATVILFPGMTPAKVLAALGLGSIAVGFAFKDIVENFFAGILILWRFPFDMDDFVECGDIVGRVEETTIRMTMIRQVDGQLVVIPNAALFKNPVKVLTDLGTRRVTVICGVAYDTDLDTARKTMEQAVQSCSTVTKDRPVEIFAREFADSSINFEVTWWTGATPREIRESRDEVVTSVKAALDKAGIEIPFPQRTLQFPEPLRVAQPSNDASPATHEG